MPSCFKCGAPLVVNEEGVAPVLCDRCAGVATGRARRSLALSGSPVTAALMAICIVAFVLELIPGLHIRYWGVNWGPLTLSGEYWRLFTAGFLHGDIVHIALNMWCLWSVGRLSEKLFGHWQTLFIFILTGIGGSLLSIAWDQNRSELGASGAIFGIVGAVMAGVKFGDLKISHGEKRAILSSVISFAVLNFALGASNVGMFANVDNMCHLGGFVTGLLLGLPLGAFHRKHAALQVATMVITAGVLFAAGRELVQTHGGEAERSLARMAGEQGAYDTQAEYLEKYTRDNPGDEQALLELGNAYAQIGENEKATKAFQHVLALNPNSSEAKEALQELHAQAAPQQK